MPRRKRRRNPRLGAGLLAIALVALFIGGAVFYNRIMASHSGALPGQSGAYGDLLKVVDTFNRPDTRLKYKAMDISFNADDHIPNWVAWELLGSETDGEIPRARSFSHDDNVAGCAWREDYVNSGYDRGHMAPAGDMKWDREAMRESFLLTNVAPQCHALNGGSWKTVEELCRKWAVSDSAIIIVCGPVPGETPIERIGESRVSVPRRFFKVVLSPYVRPARAIGFVMRNSDDRQCASKCYVSVDEVERLTGYDFFSELPDTLENAVEAKVNPYDWEGLNL